jgi:hypothetical protein
MEPPPLPTREIRRKRKMQTFTSKKKLTFCGQQHPNTLHCHFSLNSSSYVDIKIPPVVNNYSL